jgi:hypothetical protein
MLLKHFSLGPSKKHLDALICAIGGEKPVDLSDNNGSTAESTSEVQLDPQKSELISSSVEKSTKINKKKATKGSEKLKDDTANVKYKTKRDESATEQQANDIARPNDMKGKVVTEQTGDSSDFKAKRGKGVSEHPADETGDLRAKRDKKVTEKSERSSIAMSDRKFEAFIRSRQNSEESSMAETVPDVNRLVIYLL